MKQNMKGLLAVATLSALVLSAVPATARDNQVLTWGTGVANFVIEFDPAIGWFHPTEDFQGNTPGAESCGPAFGGLRAQVPEFIYRYQSLGTFHNLFLQDTENTGLVQISDETGPAAAVTDNCGVGAIELLVGCDPIDGCFTNEENFIGLSDLTVTANSVLFLDAAIGADLPADSTVIATVTAWNVTSCSYASSFDDTNANFLGLPSGGALGTVYQTVGPLGAADMTTCADAGTTVDYESTLDAPSDNSVLSGFTLPATADHVAFGNGADDSAYLKSCLDLSAIVETLAGGGINTYTDSADSDPAPVEDGIDSHDWLNVIDLDSPSTLAANALDGIDGDGDNAIGGVSDPFWGDNGC